MHQAKDNRANNKIDFDSDDNVDDLLEDKPVKKGSAGGVSAGGRPFDSIEHQEYEHHGMSDG